MRRASTSSPTRGLVQKKQIRIAANRQRKQHTLPLPAGEIAKLSIPQFLEPGGGQHFANRHRLLVITREQIDVLADAQRFRNPAHLQHRARSHPVFRIRGVAAENAAFPELGCSKPKQQFHRCRLARAVRAEQRHDLSGVHPEINPAQRPHVAIILVYAFETGHHRSSAV